MVNDALKLGLATHFLFCMEYKLGWQNIGVNAVRVDLSPIFDYLRVKSVLIYRLMSLI